MLPLWRFGGDVMTEGMVETAEYAIRNFAGNTVDRETAAEAARFWYGWDLLSRRTKDAVLERFPVVEREPVEGKDFWYPEVAR